MQNRSVVSIDVGRRVDEQESPKARRLVLGCVTGRNGPANTMAQKIKWAIQVKSTDATRGAKVLQQLIETCRKILIVQDGVVGKRCEGLAGVVPQ